MHNIRDKLGSTNLAGMRSRASSGSSEKRGHMADVAQQAPQAWQGETSIEASIAPVIAARSAMARPFVFATTDFRLRDVER